MPTFAPTQVYAILALTAAIIGATGQLRSGSNQASKDAVDWMRIIVLQLAFATLILTSVALFMAPQYFQLATTVAVDRTLVGLTTVIHITLILSLVAILFSFFMYEFRLNSSQSNGRLQAFIANAPTTSRGDQQVALEVRQ